LTCAGRTDTGVHAWGQVVTLVVRSDADLAALQRSVNRALRPSIVVRAAEPAPPGFDARRSALARCYRYTIRNDPVPDPFMARIAWHVTAPLDIAAMRLAGDAFIGEHDFSAFCRRPPIPDPSMIRVVKDARWVALGGPLLRFDIVASSFCHQMVRSIVGTLVDVGAGKRRAGEMTAVLRSGSRSRAGQLAPAHGLCLWEVQYPCSPDPLNLAPSA
jgi:tRNA pseudouridine38-40 synthase